MVKADGSYLKEIAKIQRQELLILDDSDRYGNSLSNLEGLLHYLRRLSAYIKVQDEHSD
jgi:5S rRNA maturation endonuclease (ribonuclease M5)